MCHELWHNIHMENREKYTAEKREYDVAELLEQNRLLEEQLKGLQEEYAQLQKKNETLQDQLKAMLTQMYGRRSERFTSDDQVTIADLGLNEAEYVLDTEGSAEEELVEVKATKRRLPKKRAIDVSRLPVTVKEYTLSEDELQDKFPEGWKRFDDEVFKTLEYEPAKFSVTEHHVAVYHGKSGNIARAPHPKTLLKRSVVTPSVGAAIMNAKYVNAIPLYRLEQEFDRSGIHIPRINMAHWVVKLAEVYLSLMADRLKKDLMRNHVIHADETPVRVSKDGRKANSKSYMWVYRNREVDEHKVVIYDYRKTRAESNIEDFVGDFSGTIVCDGYSAYHKLQNESKGQIKICGCWAHTRRKFSEIEKSAKGAARKKKKVSLAVEALSRIKELYAIEEGLKGQPSEEIRRVRDKDSRPVVDELFKWAREQRQLVTKGSNIGKAFDYMLGQEEYLRGFLDDPEVPLDNNTAERAIRPFCIGKKNWVMIDTVSGAEASAIIYSLAETAKANDLNPYEYFKYLLDETMKHMDDTSLDFLEDLLPWSESLPDKCRSRQNESDTDTQSNTNAQD